MSVERLQDGALGGQDDARLLVLGELAQGGLHFDQQGAGGDQPVETVAILVVPLLAGLPERLAEQAIISASMASFLARRPADLAK